MRVADDRSLSTRTVTASTLHLCAGTGISRSNNDKQFLYINGRPVDIPKVTKAFNEVWRQYEMKHKPAYVVNLILRRGTFDINVTPDKREVLLTEVRLGAALRQLYGSCVAPAGVWAAEQARDFATAS